jgi:multiple sugar transport system permease protein
MATNISSSTGREGAPYLYFILPALLLVGVILAFPIVYSVGISTFTWHLVDTSQRMFVGLGKYVELFKDAEFWNSLKLQLGFILIAIPIELVIGFFVALLLNRSFPGAHVVRTLLLLPVFVLPVLSGLTWRFMFMPQYGPVSYLAGQLGFQFPPFFGDPHLAYLAVIIQDIWRMWPFMFMILYAGLSTMSKSLLEAAEIDGATFWNKVFNIYIPILRPTIVTALLLRVIDALRIFSEVFVMTEGGPGNATTLFSIYVHRQAFRYFNVGTASAMAIFLLLLTLIFAMTLVRRHMNLEEM